LSISFVFLSAVRLDHRHGNRYSITIFSDNNLGIRTRSNICKVRDKLGGIKVQYFLAAAHHQINANNPTPASTTTASNGQKIIKWGITIHVFDSHRLNCWEEEDDAEEGCPRTCPDVDVPRISSKVDWSGSKVFRPDYFTHDGNAITPIEGNSANLPLAKVSKGGTLKMAEMAV
jgi:hypothetical protein